MSHRFYHQYISYNEAELFTVVCLPGDGDKFPTVIYRTPYVDKDEDTPVAEICAQKQKEYACWLERGYAVVFQHCRGQGKSTGAFVPYVHEREDGLALRDWIREQPFYNGELYLVGGSYTASLHYATAPFESDIKGAVFEVQDSERYRLWYRNGQMRKGHANWHFGLYKRKCGLSKHFDKGSFSQLPLKGLSERVLGECAPDFEQMLEAASPSHEFWDGRFGGSDARGAVSDADIPILLTTGYNDFYVGGVFRMWENMSERTKRKSALLVSPYDHGDSYDQENGIFFPNGKRTQAFGADYKIAWLDHVRKGTPLPYQTGVVTYYRAFEDGWRSDFFGTPTKEISLPLGTGSAAFCYDPLCPPALREEGVKAEEMMGRADAVSVCTPAFPADTFVKGRVRVTLTVASSAADTSFFLRLSIKKPEYTYVLRHDITSLCYQLGDYRENDVVALEFCFDEYAFLIKKGECLQLDISSTNDNGYVCHTNQKGAYYLQTEARIAANTVHLDRSCLILPVE